jgi:pilus assembly protein Flp/PilA
VGEKSPTCFKISFIQPKEKGRNTMLNKMMTFVKDEEGATMVEYALMVALIAVVAVGAVRLLGGAVNTKFGAAETEVAK